MKQNKKFIEEQIGKTVDALNRDRLYSLLGQEVEREMMARNREQFGFRIIDVPRIPASKELTLGFLEIRQMPIRSPCRGRAFPTER
jgi:hypothetical protein